MSTAFLKEKRVHPRTSFNRVVHIEEDSGKITRMLGVNYSLSGMAINSNSPLVSGEFIELNFRLNEKNNHDINITAEVIQSLKQGNFYLTGLKFVGELSLNR